MSSLRNTKKSPDNRSFYLKKRRSAVGCSIVGHVGQVKHHGAGERRAGDAHVLHTWPSSGVHMKTLHRAPTTYRPLPKALCQSYCTEHGRQRAPSVGLWVTGLHAAQTELPTEATHLKREEENSFEQSLLTHDISRTCRCCGRWL